MFPVSALDQQEVRNVEFTKGPSDSLGISIAGGLGSPLGDVPIFIAMMNPGGLAAQTQQLKVRSRHGGRIPLGRLGLDRGGPTRVSGPVSDSWGPKKKFIF